MTAIDDAIEAAVKHSPELDSFLLTSAIIEVVEQGHLIPADQLEQVECQPCEGGAIRWKMAVCPQCHGKGSVYRKREPQ